MSWAYLEDASGYRGFADKVLVPASEPELLEIVNSARTSKTPLTIAGAGSGITGGRCPEGGWLISMEKFTKLEIHPGLAVCGAGVHLMDLHAATSRTGQFYPPDPTETLAAVGGTIACNASGSRSFKYGATQRWIERLRVLLMDGRVLDVRRGDRIDFDVPDIPQPKACKHSAGYPLARDMAWIDLFAGSEGTLGIVIEGSLKLLPSPKCILAGVVFFRSEDGALDALDNWRTVAGLRMLEYIDGDALDLIRAKYPQIPTEACGALIIEQVDFGESELDAWTERMNRQCALEKVSWFGSTDADRERFREFRHALPETVLATVQQHKFMSLISDFAVPVNKHREMLRYYRQRLSQSYIGRHVIYGHVGSGHYHVNLLPSNQPEFEQGQRLFDEFARKAVEMGGTVAAEHGLGKRKRDYLKYQYNPQQIGAMMAVKRLLDPDWLLGRGTLFEAPGGTDPGSSSLE
ncbi:MAG TPA: FAD-binding oxidoreductase [Bryobacteraceae bacterium]|nr:FAD-binding oxidoreductase [Bryobacteraceae bacterium]